MTYDRQILQILTEVGEKGISVALLSKHVYNLNNSLFSTADLEEIRNYVRQYVQKNSKSDNSLLERMERWGYYRLNTKNNADARQLVLEFREPTTEEKEEKPATDLSLSLFDWFSGL